tara:strand:+ start:80 stop:709 length:630 start_codon:yes stop_codon:yes gene_type:complete
MESQIIEMFAKPVYKTIIPPEFKYIVRLFSLVKMDCSKNQNIKRVGCKSFNTYLLSNKEYKSFSNHILKSIQEFGDMLGYQYEDYKITQSWLTWKYPGHSHTGHWHANSLISGVFYYGEIDKHTPSIIFDDSDFYSKDLKPDHKPNKDYRFSYHTEEVKVEPGMLLLFPSYLTHSVPVNNTNYIRKSLAFNSVPKKGLGDEPSLTELLF